MHPAGLAAVPQETRIAILPGATFPAPGVEMTRFVGRVLNPVRTSVAACYIPVPLMGMVRECGPYLSVQMNV
jgi:hypothetical protein